MTGDYWDELQAIYQYEQEAYNNHEVNESALTKKVQQSKLLYLNHISDARFTISATSPQEMLDILRNPLNGMQEVLDAVGVTLENKIKTRELDRKIKEEREQKRASNIKKPQQNQSASSQTGQDLTTGYSIDNDAENSAKIHISKQGAKYELNKLVHKYVGQRKTRGFISDLAKALGNRDNTPRQTYYFDFQDKSGNPYTLRISNHNVNGENIADNEKEYKPSLAKQKSPNKPKLQNNASKTPTKRKNHYLRKNKQEVCLTAYLVTKQTTKMDYREMMQYAPKECQPTVIDTNKDYQEALKQVAKANNKAVEELNLNEKEQAMQSIGLCDLDFLIP